MKRSVKQTILVLTAALCLAIAGAAEAQEAKPTLFIVSVGISKHQDKKNDRGVKFAAKDATDVAQFFKSQQGKLFDRVECKLLTDNQATSANIRQALEWLAKNAGDSDYVVVFFAGHGGPNSLGQFAYSCHDTMPMLDSTRFHGQAVCNVLQRTKGKRFVMLDTCFSGSFASQGRDFVTLAASLSTETSSEHHKIGNGFFTHAFIEGMEGKADANKDGQVTLAELMGYLSVRVPALSDGRQQSTLHRPDAIPSSVPVAFVK